MKFTLTEVLVIEDIKSEYIDGAITFRKADGWVLFSQTWDPQTQRATLRFERIKDWEARR